ncbi:hypothetical protein [Maridesulfovibrio sp.]|uniref:hypothetical protein n=1 Tax=Maridesulfovibrio sp. TaxID=2795000 RepID=UPI002A186F7F|nr:hypothetical protein [Maridesulfovibrio sp.]
MESEVQISITCKGLWSPKTTGDEKNLVTEIKELLSELLCLEKVEFKEEHGETAEPSEVEIAEEVRALLEDKHGLNLTEAASISTKAINAMGNINWVATVHLSPAVVCLEDQ